jgi:peptidyl-Lys metalloendopeptidase
LISSSSRHAIIDATLHLPVGNAYSFSNSGAGTYDIHAENSFLIVNEDNTVSTIHADSQAHTAKIAGKLATVRPTPIAKRASYVGCSSSEQTSLVSAASAAQSYAASAYAYASSHSSSTTRYTTWFGTFTTARYNTVLSQFTSINSNTFSSFTFDCTCTESDTYAYVYPDT